jgi:hypothetical protein
MAIQLPGSPDGPSVLARFCRELAREAGKLADELDQAATHDMAGGSDE